MEYHSRTASQTQSYSITNSQSKKKHYCANNNYGGLNRNSSQPLDLAQENIHKYIIILNLHDFL